jgi:hypothetical protein
MANHGGWGGCRSGRKIRCLIEKIIPLKIDKHRDFWVYYKKIGGFNTKSRYN